MSNLALPNGDDHPEAAKKHLLDAGALADSAHTDGSAYLAGYVIECSLKALLLLERRLSGGALSSAWSGSEGHHLKNLHSTVNTTIVMAGAKAAKYVGKNVQNLPSAAIMAWNPEMRYRAPSVSNAQSATWLSEARSIYNETVGQMILDGVI